MNKTQKVVKQIAQDLFIYNQNDRIKTVDEYCILAGSSRGIVQRAIKLLEQEGVVSFVSKGQTGTFIDTIDYSKLLEYAEINHILGSMPLPYSKLYEGLASSIIAMLHNYTRASFAYTRGALNRLLRTEDRIYDFTIVSKHAIDTYLKSDKESKLEVVKSFGKGSYVQKHMAIYNKDCLEKQNITMGVDIMSQDHKLLVAKLTEHDSFKDKKITYKNLSSYKILDSLRSSTIDATVWSFQQSAIAGIDENKIILEDITYNTDFTEAALVVHRDNTLLKTILKMAIDSKEVIAYQQKVVNGQIIPEY